MAATGGGGGGGSGGTSQSSGTSLTKIVTAQVNLLLSTLKENNLEQQSSSIRQVCLIYPVIPRCTHSYEVLLTDHTIAARKQ